MLFKKFRFFFIGIILFISLPVLGFFFLLLPGFAGQESILLDDFSGPLARQWQKKSFNGETEYRQSVIDDQPCLRAESKASASGLFYQIDFSAKEYPILKWSWRIENIIPEGNAHEKAGDDYPARIYVVFPHFFFWQTKAINYIWANSLPQGTFLPNAYTKNDVMIAQRSGSSETGRWLHEERNIYQDYVKAFGKEPPPVGAIAIMTDTDDTGSQATACYGPISIHKSAEPSQQNPR